MSDEQPQPEQAVPPPPPRQPDLRLKGYIERVNEGDDASSSDDSS